MIEVGDLVRIKNCHLRATGEGFATLFQRRRRDWKMFRGRQVVARVIRIAQMDQFDMTGRWNGRLVEVDCPLRAGEIGRSIYSEFWLQVHRKHRRRERGPQGPARR